MFLPVLAVLARVQVAFSLAFLVPLGWARFHDSAAVQWVWLGSFLLALVTGLVLWRFTRHHRRELLARDGDYIGEAFFSPDDEATQRLGGGGINLAGAGRRRRRSGGRHRPGSIAISRPQV